MDDVPSILSRTRPIRATATLRRELPARGDCGIWPQSHRVAVADRGPVSQAILALSGGGYRPLTLAEVSLAGVAVGLPRNRLAAYLRGLLWLVPMRTGEDDPTYFLLSPIAVRTARLETAPPVEEAKPPERPKLLGRFADRTGNRYGRLVVLGYAESVVIGEGKLARTYTLWLCRCDCGAESKHHHVENRRCCSLRCPLNRRNRRLFVGKAVPDGL